MKRKSTKILPITISLLVGGLAIVILPSILIGGTTTDKTSSSSTTKPPTTNPNEKEYKYNLFYLYGDKITSSVFKTNYSFEKMIDLLNKSNDKFIFGDKEILLSNFLYLKYFENSESKLNKSSSFSKNNLLYAFNFKNETITFREPSKTLEELNNIKKSNNVFSVDETKSIYNSKHIQDDIYKYSTPLDFSTVSVNHRDKNFFKNIDILKNKKAEEIVDGKLINQKLIFDNINLFLKGKHNIDLISKIRFGVIYMNYYTNRKGFTFSFWITGNSVYDNGELITLPKQIYYNVFWEY